MPELNDHVQQLVAFYLSKEEYGVAITQVQEVIRKIPITRIPGMQDFIEGVVNLRGRIIPVIDLRTRFGFARRSDSDKTRIIVTKAVNQIMGLVVDGVSEVVNLHDDQVDPIPPTISSINAEYLSGVGKLENRLVILLNLECLLNDLEKTAIEVLGKKDKAAIETAPSEEA